MVINKLIGAFVTLIVGVVLLGTIATMSSPNTQLTNIVNETHDLTSALTNGATGIVNTTYPFTVTNYPTDWKVDDCPLTSISIVNATDSALTRNTDYTFYPANGTFTLKGTTVNTTFFTANNNSYVSYDYCGDDYINIAWGRTAISVSIGLFAIALLIVSVALFFSVARDYGLV